MFRAASQIIGIAFQAFGIGANFVCLTQNALHRLLEDGERAIEVLAKNLEFFVERLVERVVNVEARQTVETAPRSSMTFFSVAARSLSVRRR